MNSMKSILCVLLFTMSGLIYGATLKGTVYGTQEFSLIAGAHVAVSAIDSITKDSLVYDAYSAEDGSYLIENIPTGQFQVNCAHPEYDSYSTVITFAGKFDIIVLDIYLSNKSIPLKPDSGYAFLQGMVFDSLSGNHVYPAIVTIYNDGSSFIDSTLNNPDGSYLFENIEPGSYYLSCYAENDKPVYNIVVELSPGANYQDIFLEPLKPVETGFITGRVIFDETGNAVYGAYIEFRPHDERSYLFSAITGPDGNYSAEIPVGEYIVICEYCNIIYDDSTGRAYSPPGCYHEYYDNQTDIPAATPVRIYPQEVTSSINFGIPPLSIPRTLILSGRVTDQADNPIEAAKVCLEVPFWNFRCDSISLPSDYTDANGEYSIIFDNLYQLSYLYAYAEKQGYYTEYYQEKREFYEADPIYFLTDSVRTGINFTLEMMTDTLGLSSLSGMVMSDSGESVAGAFIIGINIDNQELVVAYSDSTGYYALSKMKPGNYYLLFLADGFIYEFYNNALTWEEACSIAVYGDITGVDVYLAPIESAGRLNKVIGGKVTDNKNQPVAGTVIGIYHKSGNPLGYALTNHEGNYRILLNDLDNSEILASKYSYKSEMKNIVKQSGKNMLEVNFMLLKTTSSITTKNQGVTPGEFLLNEPYPNPFNPNTTISFSIPKARGVKIVVYNILGQCVKILVDKEMQPGSYQTTWDGRDTRGTLVATGIYFLSLEAKDKRLLRKMIFTK